MVDGTQGIVHRGIDVQALDIDFFVFSAHKLYDPIGLRYLYQFEVGTPNIAGVLAFNTVIDWMKAMNWQQAENYAIALTDYTENQLAKLPKTSFDR